MLTILVTMGTTVATSAAAMCGCWIGIQAADAALKAGGKALKAVKKGVCKKKIRVEVTDK